MGIKDFNFKTQIEGLSPVGRNIVMTGLIVLLVISLGCMFEDFTTSYHGLEMLPGRIANDWLRYLLAIAPMALQIVFMFVAVSQRNKVAIGITFIAFLFDFGTDYAFKIDGVEQTLGNVLTVAIYSWFIMSFFSEIMLTFTLQHIAFALGPTMGGWWAGLKTWWAGVKQAAQQANIMDDMQSMMYPSDTTVTPKKAPSGRGRSRSTK